MSLILPSQGKQTANRNDVLGLIRIKCFKRLCPAIVPTFALTFGSDRALNSLGRLAFEYRRRLGFVRALARQLVECLL